MAMMISWDKPVNPSHPYLENDPAPSFDPHHLRISPWLWFRALSGNNGLRSSSTGTVFVQGFVTVPQYLTCLPIQHELYVSVVTAIDLLIPIRRTCRHRATNRGRICNRRRSSSLGYETAQNCRMSSVDLGRSRGFREPLVLPKVSSESHLEQGPGRSVSPNSGTSLSPHNWHSLYCDASVIPIRLSKYVIIAGCFSRGAPTERTSQSGSIRITYNFRPFVAKWTKLPWC